MDTPQDPQAGNNDTSQSSLPLQLSGIAFTRTVLYTGHRMVYPFLPVIARGLGVSLEMAALAVTVRSALGVFSPVLGALGDVQGRKRAMLVGILCFIVGSLVIAVLPTYTGLLAGLILAGVGLMFFDPAIQAYVGDRVPYERRALGMAAVEFGWSGAFLLGVPLVGMTIERSQWNIPFYGLAGLGVLSAVLMIAVLPGDVVEKGQTITLGEGLKTVVTHIPSIAALAVTFVMITGTRSIMIIYGAWFETAFGMSPERLGIVSSVVGAAGLVGLVFVGLISDALGKRWSMILGLSTNLFAAVTFPFLGHRVWVTVSALFLFFASFEFTVVTGFSLLSELRPRARATLMAFNAAALSGGDALGSYLGSQIYSGTIRPNAVLSAALSGAAILLLLFVVRVKG